MIRRVMVFLIPMVLLAGAARAVPQEVPFDGVGTNHRLSEDLLASEDNVMGERQAEPDISINPNDPDNAVAVVQEGRHFNGGAQAIGYATTIDGGQTWASGLLPGLTEATDGTYERATDPVVSFGPDGSVYVATLLFDDSSSRQAISVNRALDGGLSWEPPTFVGEIDSPDNFWDKEWIVVDTSTDSPFLGRVYVVWKDFSQGASNGPQYGSHSDDGGVTWSSPVLTTTDPGALGAQPIVAPSGIVHVVYTDADRLRITSSADGGDTWGKPRTITHTDFAPIPGLRTGDFLSSATVDPVTGAIHVVWQDARRDRSDVFLASSLDGGTTFGDAHKVNRKQKAEAQFTADVAAHSGTVHVIYYSTKDRRSDPDLYNLFYSGSLDVEGTKFSAPLRVTSKSFNMKFATTTTGGLFVGDYIGLAASSDRAYAAWVGTSYPSGVTGAEGQPDLYGARISR